MSEQRPKEEQFVPHPSAVKVAEIAVNQILKANGNPDTMTLDRDGLVRVVAYAVDCMAQGVGVNWK